MRFDGKKIEVRPLDSLNKKVNLENQFIIDFSEDDENFELCLSLKEKILEFKNDFKNDIFSFLENLSNKKNIKYNIEKINNTIDNLSIRFSQLDTFLENKENTDEDTIAYYSSGYINFNLSDFLLKRFNLKKIFYHELLHAISTNNDKIIYEIEEDDGFKKTIGHQSTGLKFKGLKNKRFEWLNEAVTENLAIKISNVKESESYIKERHLLDLLSKKKKEGVDLDFDLLIKTYFRHIQKREEGESSEVDEWRSFSKKVDEAFGPGFLLKLDLFIEKMGIDKAIEIISLWADNTPNVEDLIVDNGNVKIPKSFYDVEDNEL